MLLNRIRPVYLTSADRLNTQECKELLKRILKNKVIYKRNRSFILRLIEYYSKHKRMTTAQYKALERLIKDG